MSDFKIGKVKKKEPWAMAFFNNWGGSFFTAEQAFDFANTTFIPYKGCAYAEELQAARWGTESDSGLVIGYSKEHKMGFIPVDLSHLPEDEREHYEPSPEHFIILKEIIDQIDPPPVAPKRNIVEDDQYEE